MRKEERKEDMEEGEKERERGMLWDICTWYDDVVL